MGRPKGSRNGQTSKIEASCMRCGVGFFVWPRKVKKGEGKFCSVACHNGWQKEHPRCGSLSPRFNQAEKQCIQCGALIYSTPSQEKKFCSTSCHAQYMRTLTGPKCHNWKGLNVHKVCAICGTPFEVQRHRELTAQYCSTRCMGVANKKKAGEMSANWKGGLTDNMREYSRMAQAKRRALSMASYGIVTQGEWNEIKTRHHFTCLSCGKQEPKISLTQDHIVPLSRGGSNLANNIQPLCLPCNVHKFTRTIYFEHGFEVTDMESVPREYMKIDYPRIEATVRALKMQHGIAGIEAYEERV